MPPRFDKSGGYYSMFFSEKSHFFAFLLTETAIFLAINNRGRNLCPGLASDLRGPALAPLTFLFVSGTVPRSSHAHRRAPFRGEFVIAACC